MAVERLTQEECWETAGSLPNGRLGQIREDESAAVSCRSAGPARSAAQVAHRQASLFAVRGDA